MAAVKNFYYDMLKKKIQFEQEHIISSERNFLMCKSCFWCASFLNSTDRYPNSCPECMNSELESMPISFDETYTFDYEPLQGVSLEFSNKQ